MMTRRTLRDWITDFALFLFAATFSVVTSDAVTTDPDMSEEAIFADVLAGGFACAALWLRRRWPVQLAAVLLITGSVSHFVTGPVLVALFTVAAHRPWRVTRWIVALSVAPLPVYLILRPDPDLPKVASAIVYFALVAAAVACGLAVRSRSELIASLREQADRAGAEAKREAREEMAREMHDVLAHRLSLLSLHAGALEFHPGAPEPEIQRAAGVIRDSAHRALQDLREIIGVLRAVQDGGRPQPTLAELERLVEESRAAGARVALDLRVAEPGAAPALAGRTAYRIVQEGLTNARKHAPETEVTVAAGGGPGKGLTVEVRNPLPRGGASAAIPGAGQGLIGLTERASLAGGRLEHGRAGEDFRLYAWLPWPT
ncbi:sensor histidine kinase [Streptomyces sp. 8N616]|uniref:sensor histidine kinase n=1 Tax=Streptomyces sp. 8N616 TaxID=3457414 RepID=UPI003FD0F849